MPCVRGIEMQGLRLHTIVDIVHTYFKTSRLWEEWTQYSNDLVQLRKTPIIRKMSKNIIHRLDR